MGSIQGLFEGNEKWRASCLEKDKTYFETLAKGQAPRFVWFGCSDSRVTTEQITRHKPGEIFVHRNIANQVKADDLNAMSVLYFALNVLEIRDIIVCGHTCCGGIDTVIHHKIPPYIDHWLYPLKISYLEKMHEFEDISDPYEKHVALVKLNVMNQINNIRHIGFLQELPFKSEVTLHGIVFDVTQGNLTRLIEATVV